MESWESPIVGSLRTPKWPEFGFESLANQVLKVDINRLRAEVLQSTYA